LARNRKLLSATLLGSSSPEFNLPGKEKITLMHEAVRPEPSRPFRWLVLVFVSLTMFGNYYVYDCIAPIADLLTKQLGFSDSNIGLLQAIYSIPNVFMVLIGGYVVDRIGSR
jgi:predicted MFS family arabinose efflux permease